MTAPASICVRCWTRSWSSTATTSTCSSTPPRRTPAATPGARVSAKSRCGRPGKLAVGPGRGPAWPPGGNGLDVLFHHKFSIPAFCPVSHGGAAAGNRVLDLSRVLSHLGDRINRVYNTLSIPLFCRRATRVLTNSDSLATELERLAGVPSAKMATVYAAADQRFRRVTDPDTLQPAQSPIRSSRPAVLPDGGEGLRPGGEHRPGALPAKECGRDAHRVRPGESGGAPTVRRWSSSGAGCGGAAFPERVAGALRARAGRRANPRAHRARGHARGLQRGGRTPLSVLLRELRHSAGGGDGLRLSGHHLERSGVPRGGGRCRADRGPRRRWRTHRRHASGGPGAGPRRPASGTGAGTRGAVLVARQRPPASRRARAGRSGDATEGPSPNETGGPGRPSSACMARTRRAPDEPLHLAALLSPGSTRRARPGVQRVRAFRGDYDVLHAHWPEKALNATSWLGSLAASGLRHRDPERRPSPWRPRSLDGAQCQTA